MRIFILGFICAVAPLFGWPAERNDIPSCYAYAQVAPSPSVGAPRELVVIVDQTTPLTPDLQHAALQTALRYVQPGDRVLIYQFSVYLAGSYMRLPFEGTLEVPLTGARRDQTGMDSLHRLDVCLQQQRSFFDKRFSSVFLSSVGKSDTDIAKSEIVFSLRQIAGDAVRRPASDRVVLLVSDMLENSDLSSFYSHNTVRLIDPKAELAKVEKNQGFADFSGARVYVLGAAFIPQSANHGYRSGKTVDALQAFWSTWLQRSNAHLEAFGAPSLTVDMR